MSIYNSDALFLLGTPLEEVAMAEVSPVLPVHTSHFASHPPLPPLSLMVFHQVKDCCVLFSHEKWPRQNKTTSSPTVLSNRYDSFFLKILPLIQLTVPSFMGLTIFKSS